MSTALFDTISRLEGTVNSQTVNSQLVNTHPARGMARNLCARSARTGLRARSRK